jgi:hypothetical protein
MKQFGHPDAHAIRVEAYRMEQEIVRSILKRNAGWKGVRAAEDFFTDWLKSAQLGDNVPGRRDMAYMADQGVTGADCVQRAAAIWVYSAWHPGQLPDDDRLTFALALAVLKGASRKQRGVDWDEKRQRRHFTYRHISSTTRREIGKYIRESIGVFLINLTNALAQEEQIENKRKMELSAKFPAPINSTPPVEGGTPREETEKGENRND